MRGLAIVLVLTAGAGCDLVFGPAPGGPAAGIDAPQTGDGPRADARLEVADAVAMCPGGGPAQPWVSKAMADAAIVMDDPTVPYGERTVAHIGRDIRSRGLFRFPVRTDLGPPIQLEITLRFAEQQLDCGGACESCLPLEIPGTAIAHAATNDWLEQEVTWNLREVGSGWDAPGAETPGTDHSGLGVTEVHVSGAATAFTWKAADAEDVWSWREDDELSILVIPQGPAGGGTVMVTTTVEGAVNLCNAADEPAQLVAQFCP